MKRLTLVCSIVLLLSGCLAKKKDAEAIDAASAIDPATAASGAVDTDAAAAAAAVDDAAVAPLAPLASAAVVKPTPPSAGKPKAPAAPAGNPDAPNCANARLFCNHPKVATDPKIKAKCTSFTADCLAAGGKI